MSNRVLFGQRGSDMGLWISKPGFDVLTANERQLLFFASPDTSAKALQIIQSGFVVFGTATTIDVTIPALGYYPIVAGYFYRGAVSTVTVTYPNPTTVRFNRPTSQSNPYQQYYIVTNMVNPFV